MENKQISNRIIDSLANKRSPRANLTPSMIPFFAKNATKRAYDTIVG